MDTPSSIAFYSVLLLCCSDLVRSINTDLRNQNSWNGRQHLNGTTLSTAERFRRLIPYVTYYVVGNDNDDNDVRYHYQNYQNPYPNTNTPRPVQAANNFYIPPNARQPPPQQSARYHHQHDYQTSNQLHQQQQQHTTPEYLRFPSSPKFRRPIVTATSETPSYTVQTERAHSNYYYDYDGGHTSPPRPIAQLDRHPVEYEHNGGFFLPTIPPSPTPYSAPEQQRLLFTTKAKKLRRPKPKQRPTTTPIAANPTTTTTTTDKYGALNRLLNGYDLGNRLSNKITAENIGSNIQTLSDVLRILQKEAENQQVQPERRPKPEYRPEPIDEYDTGDVGNPGRPGIDYPTLSVIPKTSFDCQTQRYKGFFGDPETHCQVWHYCDLNGGQASFLCPNGTIFNQVTLTCDWWFNVKCDNTAQLYVLNERLYKYIIPSKPSFPEDYEGPLVDKYLEDKFRETEKKKSQKNEQLTPIMMMNITTIEPDSVRTPFQQLLDVDT